MKRADMSAKRVVRRRGGFADRNGICPISKQIQLYEFDSDTRTILKNAIIEVIERHRNSLGLMDFEFHPYLAKRLSTELFCFPLNTDESDYENVISALYSVFDSGDYSEILDTIEYFANEIKIRDFEKEDRERSYFNKTIYCFVDLRGEFDDLFEKECIGYRFVEGRIRKITDKEEIQSIVSSSNTKFEKVNEHVRGALDKLSSKTDRDYKGSISECTQALECLLNIVLETEGLSLGDGIKEYCKKNNKIHPAFKKSLLEFYGYASDAAGIRHDTNNKDFEEGYDEAKMILVNTSAFINYIISTNESLKRNEE